MGTAQNMFSDLIPQQPQQAAGQNVFADLIPQQGQPQPQSGGYFSDISNNIGGRLSNVGNLIDQGRAGQISPLQAGLWGTGQLAGAVNDTVGRTIQQIPGYQTVSNAFTGGAQSIADYFDNTKAGQTFGNTGMKAEDAISDWSQNHPATTNSISALMNIAGGAPVVGGAAKAGGNILERMGENSGISTKTATLGLSNFIESKAPSPQSLFADSQNLDKLPDATKTGMFNSAPNPLETGLKANQQISQNFEADTGLQRQAYANLNKVGSSFSMPQPELYDKLNSTIYYLEGKVAEGSQEHQALSELKDIRDNLTDKYTIQAESPTLNQRLGMSAEKKGVDAYGIQPSDLVDIKTAINSGLNPNKFMTHGKSIILGLKSYVQQGLDEASAVMPDFGDALNTAENQAKKVAQYKSPSLKPLWQPEDYVAYKSGNASAPTTINRAQNFLQNMQSSTQATGRAVALANVLSPEDFKSYVKAAVLHANRNSPSLMGAAANLMPNPLHPLNYVKSGFGIPGAMSEAWNAMKGTEPSPLENLSTQIKRMKK